MSEKRHRLKKEELDPVKNAIQDRLFLLLDTRPEDELENAENLFRAWYRIENYIKHRPVYPEHDTYDLIALSMSYERYRSEEVGEE